MARARGREGRRSARRPAAGGRPWAVLVVTNIIPVVAAVTIGVLYSRGTIAFVPGSESVVPSLVVLVAGLAGLLFLSWFAAPLIGPAVRSTGDYISRQSDAIARGGPGAFVVRFPALVAGVALYAVLVVNAAILGVLIIADVVAVVMSMAVFVREVLRVRG